MGIYHLLGVRISLFFLILYSGLTSALTINYENSQGAIFAGGLVPYEITLQSPHNLDTSLSWKLISKGRTLSKGKKSIQFASKKLITTTLSLHTPPMKPGVSIEAKLIIKVQNKNNIQQKTLLVSKIIIYGPDIFLFDQHFYKQLNIQLYDPVGKTRKTFNDLHIPFTKVSKSQLMNFNERGLIVVGKGVKLDRQRGLISTLIEFSKKGINILILQPTSGTISLSELSIESGVPVVSSRLLANDSIVESFAKGYKWVLNDKMKTHGIVLQNKQQNIRAEIVEYYQGNWDWLHQRFSESDGEFIVCTLPIIGNTDGNPILQIILGRLLSYASYGTS